VIFFVLALLSLSEAIPDCSNIPGDNGYYDLTSIVGRELKLRDSFSTYDASICVDAYEWCGYCPKGAAGFCQYTDYWADGIGEFSFATGLPDDTGVELNYDNGDWGYVGRIRINCDPSVELSEPTYELNPKNMVVRSKHACIKHSPPPPSPCNKIPDAAGSGSFYDLGPIIGHQIFWKTSSDFKASVCTNPYHDCGRCDGPAGFCLYSPTWSDCVGKFSLAVGLPDSNGVQLFYDNGDRGYSGRIHILCDHTVDGISEPTFEDPLIITVRSKYACLCQWVCVPPY